MPNRLHYALVVAISECRGFQRLSGPKGDAADFKKWLRSPHGGDVPERNIVSLESPETLSGGTPSPSLDDILWELCGLLDKAVEDIGRLAPDERDPEQAKSRLYVFVAGHGIMPGDGSGGLVDARGAARGHERIGCLDLSACGDWLVDQGLFDEVVLLGDCCRNDRPITPAGRPPYRLASHTHVPTRRLTSYATSPGSMAYEGTDGDLHRGHYSRALIEALEGAAVHPIDRRVTTQRLQEYVRAHVARRTAAHPPNQRQSVDVAVVEGPGMVFGPQDREPRLHAVEIHVPDGCPHRIQLVAPDGQRVPCVVRQGSGRAELYDGLWWVEPADAFSNDPVFQVSGESCCVVLR